MSNERSNAVLPGICHMLWLSSDYLLHLATTHGSPKLVVTGVKAAIEVRLRPVALAVLVGCLVAASGT